MMTIGDYAELVHTLLVETGKYFLLLLFVVLAIRLWRHALAAAAGRRLKACLLAGGITALAAVIGLASLRHSLGQLYLFYGRSAFFEGRLQASAMLFDTAAGYWRTPEALEGEGVCLLLLSHSDAGWSLIHKAETLRHGQASAFAEYHEGLYYHFAGQPDRAQPLLQSALSDPFYCWQATKLLALEALDANRTSDAAALIQPFAAVKTVETDHAYIVAALDLSSGKTNDAREILAQFPEQKLSSPWLERFAMLRKKLD